MWLASPSSASGAPPCTVVSCPSSSPSSPSARPALRRPRPLPHGPAPRPRRSTRASRSTGGAQCTANFVFTDAANVYIGQAAHCSGTGGSTETDGCTSGSLPIGTPVDVAGASQPGTLVYNSWLTMQALGETDPDTCAYNDLALIQLDPADVGQGEPVDPVLRRPDRASAARRALGDNGLQLRQLRAARRRHPAQPEAGRQPRRRRQRLDPHRLHRDARHPRRLGQRVPRRSGQAIGVLSAPSRSRRWPAATASATSRTSSTYLHAHTAFSGVHAGERHRALPGPARCRRVTRGLACPGPKAPQSGTALR